MKTKNKRFLLCLFSAVLLFTMHTPAVHAKAAESTNDDAVLAPYFYVENADSAIDSFPLKETKVDATINGMIADIYVTQVYANEGTSPITAQYVFPTSTQTAVHGMTMTVGNQVVTAKIKEKEEAVQIYEEAKSDGKSASLLQQQRPNVFTMDVANIMPGDVISVELHYTELISPADGIYQFVFPTVTGPRYASAASQTDGKGSEDEWVGSPYLADGKTPAGTYDIHVSLSTGVPITGLTCDSHKINIDWEDNSIAHISLSDKSDYAGNRDFILNYKLTSQDAVCGLMLDEGEKENHFLLTIQPPERVEPETLPPREYIFVLDVSGSMNGFPIDTAKELITNLVSDLNSTDTFNLVLFANDSAVMSHKSVAASKKNIKTALKLIDNQEGYGGTNLAEAVETAIKMPSDENYARSIVLITDGYISGEAEVFDLIHENMDTASFFSFGIGTSVNRYLVEGVAKAGQGEAFVVTEKEAALETADKFKTYIESPVLTDIQVTYEDFEAYDIEPAVISTLYSEKPIVLFGKWKGDAEGTIHVTGKKGNEAYAMDISVAEVATKAENDALPYLWARKRVERLTDYGTYKDNPAVKEEVTKLGLDYNMITSYTSFIAVLDIVRNETGESADVDQPNPLPLQVSNLAVGGYRRGSEPGTILLFLSGSALLMLHYRKKKNYT